MNLVSINTTINNHCDRDKVANSDSHGVLFEDTAPSGLVEIDPRLRGAYCVYHQGDNRIKHV